MKITAVVRALNEEEHIGRLLVGLEQQTRQVDQIVLVDSGSTDQTVPIAERFGADVVHITPESFTFGRSLNFGCDAAKGDIIVIPSAHVFPLHSGWIESLVAPFDDPEVAVSYGRQVGGDVTKFSEHRVMARWFPPVSDTRQRHPFCNNANAAVRRDVWKRLRYDESLTGLEDLEFAKRAQAEGMHVSYVAEAAVAHIHEEDWTQVQNRYRREAIAHKRIFNEQDMSPAEAARLIAANVVGDLGAAVRVGALQEFPGIVRFRIAQFVGTYQGFRQHGEVSAELKARFYYPDRAAGKSPALPEGAERIDYEALDIPS